MKRDAVILRNLNLSFVKQRKCEFISGNTAAEKARKLAQRFHENHLIR